MTIYYLVLTIIASFYSIFISLIVQITGFTGLKKVFIVFCCKLLPLFCGMSLLIHSVETIIKMF